MTKKVIIIDDSTTQLNLIKTILTKNDWEVYSAKSAKIGYEMIFDIAPDLVITDAIMPVVGGFQLVKSIKENQTISKIPVIIYSILDAKHARYYLQDDINEYFLTKSNNVNSLVELAQKAINEHPVNEEYKLQILEKSLSKTPDIQDEYLEISEEDIENNIFEINKDELIQDFKKLHDFTLDDEEILENLFNILYPKLKYDLGLISVHSFEKKEQKVYLDVRDIILSPIFQNTILNKYNAKNNTMFKTYAPNSKTVVNPNEFNSKLEFNFEHLNKKTAEIAFYSFENGKWQNEESISIIKNILEKFFKARYINKFSLSKRDSQKKYSLHKTELNLYNKIENALVNNSCIYLVVIDIVNFQHLKENLSTQDLDIINSKISEKIIQTLNKNEQIHKNYEDEYAIIVFTKDEKELKNRINSLYEILNTIVHNENNVEAIITAVNCVFNNNYNIYEAQKIAQKSYSEALNEKVVIKNNGK